MDGVIVMGLTWVRGKGDDEWMGWGTNGIETGTSTGL